MQTITPRTTDTETATIFLRVSPELKERVVAAAEKNKVSVNAIGRWALKDFCDEACVTLSRSALENLLESASEMQNLLNNNMPGRSKVHRERAQRAIQAVEREMN